MEKFLLALFLCLAVVQANDVMVATVLLEVDGNHFAQALTFKATEYIALKGRGYLIPSGLILKRQKPLTGQTTFHRFSEAKIKMKEKTYSLKIEGCSGVKVEEKDKKLELKTKPNEGEEAVTLATVSEADFRNPGNQWILLECKNMFEFKKPKQQDRNEGEELQSQGDDKCLTISVHYTEDGNTFAYEVKLIANDTKNEFYEIGNNKYVFPAALVPSKLGLEKKRIVRTLPSQVNIKGKNQFFQETDFNPYIYEYRDGTVGKGVQLIYKPKGEEGEEGKDMVLLTIILNAEPQDNGWCYIHSPQMAEDITPQAQETHGGN